MTIDKIYKAMNSEDFHINIRPNLNKNGTWVGDVNVSILIAEDNPLNDDDYASLLHFTKMICASVPIMEMSPELRQLAHDYVMEEESTDFDFKPDKKGKVIDRTDNVVTISFGTKTEGSA